MAAVSFPSVRLDCPVRPPIDFRQDDPAEAAARLYAAGWQWIRDDRLRTLMAEVDSLALKGGWPEPWTLQGPIGSYGRESRPWVVGPAPILWSFTEPAFFPGEFLQESWYWSPHPGWPPSRILQLAAELAGFEWAEQPILFDRLSEELRRLAWAPTPLLEAEWALCLLRGGRDEDEL